MDESFAFFRNFGYICGGKIADMNTNFSDIWIIDLVCLEWFKIDDVCVLYVVSYNRPLPPSHDLELLRFIKTFNTSCSVAVSFMSQINLQSIEYDNHYRVLHVRDYG
ncbi:hypothetical protein RF11_04627 [Thelohanellus kitauei]|uniref:Uncharacterized protein n=1 Tax=Thelohanellus kitauei TaxID=669202 RepID=A0A0C2MJ82_THEKT|nr:hypothetical protein RF11_04627 [Thelohanellus kitauei]